MKILYNMLRNHNAIRSYHLFDFDGNSFSIEMEILQIFQLFMVFDFQLWFSHRTKIDCLFKDQTSRIFYK